LADGSVADVLVDDAFESQVRVQGSWTSMNDVSGRYGPTVLRGEGPGPGSVRFVPRILEAGSYRVYLYWPRAEGLATNTRVEIRHAGGAERVQVNMRTQHTGLQHGIAQWAPLGSFRFERGDDAWIEIGAEGADGVVFADAVLLVPEPRRR
jgi:hypothetical protein